MNSSVWLTQRMAKCMAADKFFTVMLFGHIWHSWRHVIHVAGTHLSWCVGVMGCVEWRRDTSGTGGMKLHLVGQRTGVD